LLFLAAFTVEKITLAQLSDRFPAPGQMVDIGPYSLHLYCAGDPSAEPVVVVSPGSNSSVAQWPLVQSGVAEFTRICIYDRFGSGWSFGTPHGQTYQEESQDVHNLLQKAGIPGPYLLVGHSMGGAVMQVYASMYPEDVAGLVMVEAVTRGMDARYPEKYFQSLQASRQAISGLAIPGLFRLMNWFGLYRTMPPLEKLPPNLRATAYALEVNSRMGAHMRSVVNRQVERDAKFESAGPLPDVPMIVLARGRSDLDGSLDAETERQVEQAWRAAQSELAAQAPDGRLVIAENSGHNIIIDQPEAVIDAIGAIVEQVRSAEPSK
jgi:pimeloyl-ACP methyl ester carboxylesterase